MAETLRGSFPDLQVELIKSSGGAFEIARDGTIIFSKLREGRFPEPEEIIARLRSKG